MNKRQIIFDWVKEKKILPQLKKKKFDLTNESNRVASELKNVENSISLFNMADEFCEFIRQKLIESLLSSIKRWEAHVDDDCESQYDGYESVNLFDIRVNIKEMEHAYDNPYFFEGKFAKLFDAYVHLIPEHYKELFDYIQEQFDFIIDEANLGSNKLSISKTYGDVNGKYDLRNLRVTFYCNIYSLNFDTLLKSLSKMEKLSSF